MRLAVVLGDRTVRVEVEEEGGRFRVRLDDEWLDVDARALSAGAWSLLLDGRSHVADVAEAGGELIVTVAGEPYRLRVEEPPSLSKRGAVRAARAGQRLVAPMPGRVVSVHVRPGDRVEAGTPLVVLEAMKMENEFRAAAAGVVADVPVAAGQAVNAGDLLVVVLPEAS